MMILTRQFLHIGEDADNDNEMMMMVVVVVVVMVMTSTNHFLHVCSWWRDIKPEFIVLVNDFVFELL